MISAVPAFNPVVTPVPSTTLALGLAVDHVPPEVGWVRVVVAPTQTTRVPPIVVGVALTVIILVE